MTWAAFGFTLRHYDIPFGFVLMNWEAARLFVSLMMVAFGAGLFLGGFFGRRRP